MFNSSRSRNYDKRLYKCSLVMVSNAFVVSSSKMLVEYSQDVRDVQDDRFLHSIFIPKTCSAVLFPFLHVA